MSGTTPERARKGPVALATLLLAGLGACQPEPKAAPPVEAERPPSVILISLDTLRADRLNTYGYRARTLSPHIDELARDGIVFENHFSTSPWTTPAHMSLLTSLHPSSHGITRSFHRLMRRLEKGRRYPRLAEPRTTLAETLAASGYATAAFTGGVTLDPRIGFDQGFELYDTSMVKLRSQAMDEMLDWVRQVRDRPFLLFWHTFETHAPYLKPDFLEEVLPAGRARSLTHALGEFEGNETTAWEAEVAAVMREEETLTLPVCEALYCAGVASADRWLGRLVKGLRDLDLYEPTLIVLTSDHGEEFGERSPDHFYDEHGHTLYRELMQVPLIFKLPEGRHAGTRVSALARLVDVMPTILDVVGTAPPADSQGVTLRPTWRSPGRAVVSAAYGEALGELYEKKSVRTDRLEYIVTVPAPLVGEHGRRYLTPEPFEPELYDVMADPGQRFNLLAGPGRLRYAELAAELDHRLRRHLAEQSGQAEDVDLDDEVVEGLRALGYVK